ncbi:MAG: Kelch repeat-containing protein, partial [Roseimicrobium sp.]
TKYLGITVDADSNPATTDKEMAPRQLVLTAFYAPTTDKLQDYGWDVLFGNQNPSTGTIQATKMPEMTLDKLPQIPGSKLAANITSDALAAAGQSTVSSGGIVMSANANNTALVGIGYSNLGAAIFTNSGSSLPSPPLAARIHPYAVWTGTEVIVWGGGLSSGDFTPFADGARYNPTTRLWTSMTSTGAPAGRRSEDSLNPGFWTGQKFLVWGGYNWTNAAGTGGLYDPIANSWSTMATSGAPSQRFAFAHAWTGSLYLVWGGDRRISNVDTDMGDGARYDPQSNTWSPISSTGAPSARIYPSYAWTGTELFVWGGRAGGSPLANGALYNPQTNTWRAISAVGAPVARSEAYAVWTGAKVIVWGGESGNSDPGGAIYDPASNSWSALPSAPISSARRRGVSVWTGDAMLISGGHVAGGPTSLALGDGAAYFPATNSWLKAADVTPRSNGAPVWSAALGLVLNFCGSLNPSTAGETNDAVTLTPPRTLYLYQKR